MKKLALITGQDGAYLLAHKADYLFIAAAKVGGIQNNLIHGAHLAGVQRLMFLGSSCIYPKLAPQPIKEDHLLTGVLEPTNEPCAIAKIAGIKMCEAYNAQYGRQYTSAMPTNLYGPNDNYDLANSHVLPALIRKAHEARLRGDAEYVVWGSGAPRREFLYVDDLADACALLMERGFDGPLINIGTGSEVTIRELAETVMRVVGFNGRIVCDHTKPDGTPRKLMDSSQINRLGWKPAVPLEEGVRRAYRDFLGR
jgi:GDP-L-fucose synthase